jgi:diaminopimelate decarboxylase
MDHSWHSLVEQAIRLCGTPCYVFSATQVIAARRQLLSITAPLPIRHWLSLKTCPLRPLLNQWAQFGEGVEVVSEAELWAAIHEGVPPSRILVNGVAKHHWLKSTTIDGLTVVFDSITECEALARVAKARNWRVGVRLHVCGQWDPDDPQYADQFGLWRDDINPAMHCLRLYGLDVSVIHFHLGPNIDCIDRYRKALEDAADRLLIGRELLVLGSSPIVRTGAPQRTPALRASRFSRCACHPSSPLLATKHSSNL